ncbi:hypothetical protein N7486_007848 [Penicillium sp. IBT 16267x]|nr:hypothetical protein N7486_007848 [Penicillium sp. IBT 16267x]
MPGEKDTWDKRYSKVVRRLGKGNKVEDLMIAITQDVQLIVNKHAVNSATPEQKAELNEIIKEMKSLPSLMPKEASSAMSFIVHGGKMTSMVHTGSGEHKIVTDNGRMYIADSQTFVTKEKEDFSFRGPVGICLGQAPHIPSELFIGRASELDKMAYVLHPGHKHPKQRRLVLGGIGDIGNTQLAIAYAESHRGSYDSVFWLDAASEAALKDSFQSIARLVFDVQEPGVLEDKEIVMRTHQWLSGPKKYWMPFKIDQYYPPASHGAIIVTTRRPDLVAGSNVPVKALENIEESLAILQTRSEREHIQSVDPYAARLAERLAGLPLALATAGAYLQGSAFTFKRYLEEYGKLWDNDPRRPAEPLKDYQSVHSTRPGIYSYNRLERDDPDAAKFLKLLAYFGNQSLWYGLFHAGLAETSPGWLREVITDDVNLDAVMRILTRYCFLEVQPTSESWSMHNCVHDWTLAILNKEIDTQHYWYAVDCIAASMNGADEDYFGHISYSRLAAHATRLRYISSSTPGRLNLASSIARLLREQIQLVAAEQMYIRALAGYEKALGPDHTSTLAAVNNLGLLYRDQGKLDKAEQMYNRALAGYEKELGADNMSTLNTVNGLGFIYRDQGKLNQAEQMYNRALAGYEKELGAEQTSTLNTVCGLGILYRDQDKLDEAEQMYQRALAGYENALGPNPTSTLETVNNLGILYQHQGKLDKAERMYMRAGLGKEKRNTATCFFR